MSDDRMLQEHQGTYHGFLKVATYASAAIAAVLILMALFLL